MMRRLLLYLGVALPGFAATYNSADCQYATVAALAASAADGDTINIHSGNCTWSSQLQVINKGLQFVGAGQGVTTITDNAGGAFLFYLMPRYGNQLTRVSSMTISHGNATVSAVMIQGTCAAGGCANFRIDHVTLGADWIGQVYSDSAITRVDNVFGVYDHNTFGTNGTCPTNSNAFNSANVNHSGWLGVGVYGDNSWAQGNTFGTNQAVYLEDNTFYCTFGTDTESGDGYAHGSGGRLVCRFNTFTGLGGVSACGGHGTETTGRPRGLRQGEFYANSVTGGGGSAAAAAGFGARSGPAMVFGNTYGGANLQYSNSLSVQRANRPTGWPQCSGLAPYDVNDGMSAVLWSGTVSSYSGNTLTVSGPALGSYGPSGGKVYVVFNKTHGAVDSIASVIDSSHLTTGYYSGQVMGPFYGGYTFLAGDSIVIYSVTLYDSGTTTSAGALLVDSTKNWTAAFPGGLYGYSVVDITQGYAGQLASNTATTATFYAAPMNPNTGQGWGGWASGDQYLITRATRCLDASTYGGSLMSGEVPDIPSWAQTLSPTYQFADTGTVTVGWTSSVSANIIANRDYYSMNASFNGTSGTGYGPRSSRPSTCTAGVAYFSTDQGTWNQSSPLKTYGPGGISQGVLDICTATNTWTDAAYTPYTYPHPLVNGGGGSCSIAPTAVGPYTATQRSEFTTFTASGCNPSTYTITAGSLNGSGLSLNSNTGQLTSASGAMIGTYTFTVGYDTASTGSITLTINTAPGITTNTLPDAARGSEYSQTLTTTGGTGSVTCTVTSGSLPPGLALTGCVISGTPQ